MSALERRRVGVTSHNPQLTILLLSLTMGDWWIWSLLEDTTLSQIEDMVVD